MAWALWPCDDTAAAAEDDLAAAEMRRQHVAGKAALVAAALACPHGDDADAARSTAWFRQLQRPSTSSSTSTSFPAGGGGTQRGEHGGGGGPATALDTGDSGGGAPPPLGGGPHDPPRAMDIQGLISSAPMGAEGVGGDDVDGRGEASSLASLCPSFASAHIPLAYASSGPALEKHLGVVLAAVMRGGSKDEVRGEGGKSKVGEQAVEVEVEEAEARLLRVAAVVQALDSLLEGAAADSRVSVCRGLGLGLGLSLCAITRLYGPSQWLSLPPRQLLHSTG